MNNIKAPSTVLQIPNHLQPLSYTPVDTFYWHIERKSMKIFFEYLDNHNPPLTHTTLLVFRLSSTD